MAFSHLTYRQRCQIQALWKIGVKQKRIAQEVGVSQPTISREINRGLIFIRTKLGYWQYKADYAHFNAIKRQKNKPRFTKLTPEVIEFITAKIKEKWSPEQICGYGKKHDLFSLCHDTIYRFLLMDKEKGGKLYMNLRHKNKKYRKRYGSAKRTGPIKNRRMIDNRPWEVRYHNRLGDWEIDTIVGKGQRDAIVSIVERTTKKTILKKVNRKTAENVANVTIEGLKELKDQGCEFLYSITADNGSEFAQHERISKELNTDFFFAHPYSSWERGLNENTNGLVRQYFKKGSSFHNITQKDLDKVELTLNTRPRKSLNYETPNERFIEDIETQRLINRILEDILYNKDTQQSNYI